MYRSRLLLCALCTLLCFPALLSGVATAQEEDTEAAPQAPPPPEIAQPAYDVFRIADGGVARAYRVWEEWVPQIVTTPDGGAWAFFTAQARTADGFGPRALYASRFDPAAMVWQAATPLSATSTQLSIRSKIRSPTSDA